MSANNSVKSLVQSYEEFPSKEKNEIDHKIWQMREERNKELQSAVEQSRIALTETHLKEGLSENFVGHIENSPPNETTKNEELEKIHQHQRQLQQKANQQKLLQKELSTISERTEQSSSLNGCLAAMAVSNMTNTTATAISPQITNAISQSRATTVTKSIRHLDPNKFNFLDSSTGASADILSAKNANNSSGLLSTPVQTSNTNILNNTNSSTKSTNKQTTDSNPKNEYFEFSNRSSETVVNNTIGTTSTSSTIIPNVKETVAKLNKCPTFIPRIPMESSAKRNDMHRQVTNNMFKSQLVDKGLMKFVEKKNRYIYGNVNENEEEDEVDEEEEDESDTDSDDEEEYNEQEQDFNDYVKRKDRMEDNRRRILQSNHSHFGDVPARELNSCQNDRVMDECRKNSNNKSNYSSQEDFLSSLHVIISNF